MTKAHNLQTVVEVELDEPPVELWRVDKLIPYENNNKNHSPESIEKLAMAIKRQGLIEAVSVDKDGVIISGHRRLEAFKFLERTFIPVRVRDDLDENQVKEARIAANTNVGQDYDKEALAAELRTLDLDDEELAAALGWDESEMDKMLQDSLEQMEAELSSVDMEIDERSGITKSNIEPTSREDLLKKDVGEKYQPSFQVIVTVDDADEQEEVYDLLMENGHDNLRVMSA